jgi:hypothetical protein
MIGWAQDTAAPGAPVGIFVSVDALHYLTLA